MKIIVTLAFFLSVSLLGAALVGTLILERPPIQNISLLAFSIVLCAAGVYGAKRVKRGERNGANSGSYV